MNKIGISTDVSSLNMEELTYLEVKMDEVNIQHVSYIYIIRRI